MTGTETVHLPPREPGDRCGPRLVEGAAPTAIFLLLLHFFGVPAIVGGFGRAR
jgi:hypothetical protein